MAEFCDFEFICSHNLGLHTPLPAWDSGGPYYGRATRAFIELLHGPLRRQETIARAFEQDAIVTARRIACEKLKATQGVYDPPMIVDTSDL